MARILPISEVKARLPELVTGVEHREEEIVVTRKASRRLFSSTMRSTSGSRRRSTCSAIPTS